MSGVALAPTLLASFDASVLYEADNATPSSAAVGVYVTDGAETYCERSLSVDAFVSSTALEYRALVEAASAVTAAADTASAVHFRGDADVVLRTTDPDRPAEPSDRLLRRRVATVRAAVADVPEVTYRTIPRESNREAHRLARAGHDVDGNAG